MATMAVDAAGAIHVRATGVAALGPDKGQSRDEALRDALRRAVEQALGVTVRSKTLMVDLAVVQDRVTSQAAGYVRTYDVTNESQANGLYRVTIDAVVDTDLIQSDLQGFGALLRSSLGNPRVMIVASGASGGAGSAPHAAIEPLQRYLTDRHFVVVDAGSAGNASGPGSPAQVGTPALQAARAQNADVVIVTEVSSAKGPSRATAYGQIVSVRSTVSYRALLAATGQVVATVSTTSAGAAVSETEAADTGIRTAATKIIPDLVRQVVTALNTTTSSGTSSASIKVTVHGLSTFAEALKVDALLRSMRGVNDVRQRSFASGVAEFDVQGSATATDIATRMSTSSSLRLSVTYMDAYRIEATYGGH